MHLVAAAVAPGPGLRRRHRPGVRGLVRGARQDGQHGVGTAADHLGQAVGPPADQRDLVAGGHELGVGRTCRRQGLDRPGARVEDPEALAVVGPPAHEGPVRVEDGVVTHPERPLGCRVVGRDVVDEDRPVAGVAVQQPPAALVRGEPQRPVRPELRLDDGHPLPTRDDGGVPGAVGPEGRPEQAGAVPRHVRVVPLDPGEVPPVRGHRGAGEEVGAARQHPSAVLVPAVQVEPDELVRRLAPGAVGLPYGEEDLALQHETAVAGAALGGDRLRAVRPRVEPVHPVAGQGREHHGPPRDRVGPAAVLVHPGADVPRLREDVRPGLAVVSHEGLAPSLGRTGLQPPGVGPVDADLVDGPRPRGQGLGSDGRGPGAVRDGAGRHGPPP